MADIISLKEWREFRDGAVATDLLRDVLNDAACACAAGELSAAARKGLPFDLTGAFMFDDSVGLSISKRSSRAGVPKTDQVLLKVLRLAIEETETRVVSADGRAMLANAVFIALGGEWRIDRAA